MRELYVVEIKDTSGIFRPQIGLASLGKIYEWLDKYIPAEVRARTADWRIVLYIPANIEIQDVPIVH